VKIEEELETLKTELKDKGGRPREGNTYKKDKHPYGRDPLGDKERTSKRSRTDEDKIRQYLNGVSSKKQYINEIGNQKDTD